jgi:hypothetical protein
VALAEAAKRDYFPVLVTFTLQHHKGMRLDDLREALAKAFDSTFSGRWYMSLMDEYLIVGKAKFWETTIGKNGWHPHLHVLFFMRLELAGRSLTRFRSQITKRWLECLETRGYSGTWANAVDVRTGNSAVADYLAKHGREPLDPSWGIDSELALAPTKKAHQDGMTPFELLAAADGHAGALERFQLLTGVEGKHTAMQFAGRLYVEYFQAFKGKPRVYWGKLRQVLELDEALAQFEHDNPPKESDMQDVVLINRVEWAGVVNQGLQAELLIMVGRGDRFKLHEWLVMKGINALVLADIEDPPPNEIREV